MFPRRADPASEEEALVRPRGAVEDILAEIPSIGTS